MRESDDASLVGAALTNGPEAFGPIVEQYRDAVFGIALARLRNFHEAEDVAQQVFIEAFERLDQLRKPARLAAWLRAVTIHRCIDVLRRRRDNVEIEKVDFAASSDRAPNEELERRDLRNQVMSAVGRLSKAQRETTTLFYIGDYSIRDIARMQEVPIGTIKRRLHDAREKLRMEMIKMVKDTLKSEAPNEDFGQRVFELLCRYRQPDPGWPPTEIESELRRIGIKGLDGLKQAMRLPHAPTRRFTLRLLGLVHGLETTAKEAREVIVGLLKEALIDRNKKVRAWAGPALLYLEVEDERKRREFIPWLLPLLQDPTKLVRHRVAFELRKWPEAVPLEVAAVALSKESDGLAQRAMGKLVRLIVVAHESNNGA